MRLVDVVEGRVRLVPGPAAVGGGKGEVRLRAVELEPRLADGGQQDDAGAGLGDALERSGDALERRGADDRGAVPRPAAVGRREDAQLVAPFVVVVGADGQQEGVVGEDGEAAHPAGAGRRHRRAVPGASAVAGAEEALMVEVAVGAAQPGVEPDGGPDVAVARDAHAGLGAGRQAGVVEDDALRRKFVDDLAVERHRYRIAGHDSPRQHWNIGRNCSDSGSTYLRERSCLPCGGDCGDGFPPARERRLCNGLPPGERLPLGTFTSRG